MSTAASAPRLLIADDQPDVLEALRLLLKGEGFEVATTTSPGGVLRHLEGHEVDVLLMDLNYTRDTTSGREGLDLLPRLVAREPTLAIVVMTAYGSIDGAVEAMRLGARDYVEKPWDNTRLVATLRAQAELARALRESQRLREAETRTAEGARVELIAESAPMRELLRLAERVAPSRANLLITGEHGTGKDVLARWIHARSVPPAQPFVAVNVGGLAETLFESELFGHVKGAFTDARADRVGRFELADGGILFLDEIANISLASQAKLLRVLQTGEFERLGASRTKRVDVRVLAATNADLRVEVREGRFREDLLFRLNTIELRLPPLRERREDIPALATHFLSRFATRYRRPLVRFTAEAMRHLLDHGWPGNVREMEHAIERAVLLADGEEVRAQDLALRAPDGGAPALETMTLDEVERYLIERALRVHAGNVSDAARALGLSRSALYRRLERFGL